MSRKNYCKCDLFIVSNKLLILLDLYKRLLLFISGDEELDTDKNIIGTISTAAIAIIADPSDNNAIYKCVAENEATEIPLEREITLSVRCEC